MNITVLIITKNAEKTLERTVKSVSDWAPVIVIDDYSTDKTKKIARDYECTVITHRFDNFGEQRAFALSRVSTEWTLVLDSDEVLTPSNKKEIEAAVEKDTYNGYYLHFRNHLFGKKLQHGELHKKLVLFKTQYASINSKEVHEQYEVKGKIGELACEVLHYSYRSLPQIMRKFFDYSTKQAREYKKSNKKYGVKELFLNPLHMFYSRYILDGGYKDGVMRIILDKAFAAMEFFSYAFTPFVKTKKRISIDCGPYPVGGIVQSGIDRLIQGIYSHSLDKYDYYWFSFARKTANRLPTRLFSYLWLPLATIVNRCNIFLGVGGNIPWLLSFFPVTKILFLHDFGFYSSPEKYNSSSKRLRHQTTESILRADKIVVFNGEIYKEFIQRYPKFSYKAFLIPAGADHLEYLDEKPVFTQPKTPMALYVGVVKPVKRVEKIIEAVGDMHCVIAGPQEKEYKKCLQIQSSQNIQFIKKFNDNQLKWLYKKADVMVYASEHEGFCYPVLEALTLGLPVIAFDLPLFHEYKKQFPHLSLVNSVEEMKKELAQIKARPILEKKYNPYTWSSFFTSLEALWQPLRLPKLASKKIAFIVVLYKTPLDEKERLEQEIKNIGMESYAIYWIDNSHNGKGYAAGINEGIRAGLIDKCDVFIALNPDISLKSVTAENIRRISSEFDVWGFGMKQNNTTYYGGNIEKWRLSGGLIEKKPKVQFQSVDFVSGSLLGFSKEVVHTIGLWDESYFMYYEDVDYCVRAENVGLQVGIDSHVVYTHFETSQENKKKNKWIAKSRWKFFWKYSNMSQRIREIIRLPKTVLHP